MRSCLQVLVLRLRDSVVRLGEELEQSAQAEAREKENARYYQQRLQDMRLEMEELSQREQDSSRRRMELVTNAAQGAADTPHPDTSTNPKTSATLHLR